MTSGTHRHWLRWNWIEAFGLAVLSAIFILLTFKGTDPAKSGFLDLKPYPDCTEYAVVATRIYHGLGANLEINGHQFPSRYPLGFPLALAMLQLLFGGSVEMMVAWAPIIFLVASIWVFHALLRHCAGATPAWMGAFFFTFNPCVLTLTTGLYSESLLALLTVLTVGWFLETVESGAARAAILFGIVFGFSTIVRTQVALTAPFFIIAYFFLPGRRPGVRPVAFAICGALPFVATQAILQWRQFGSPFSTGYDYHMKDLGLVVFSPGYIIPNLELYIPGLFLGRDMGLTGFTWVFMPVTLVFLLIAGMIHTWQRDGYRAVILSILFAGMTIVFFSFYRFTDIRFFIQVLILFFAWAGIGAAWIASLLNRPWRIPALVAIATILMTVPIGSRETPAAFVWKERTWSNESNVCLSTLAICRTIPDAAPGGPKPVLITGENLVLLDFYSDKFQLHPLSKWQEYMRVRQIRSWFPDTVDALLKKGPVYLTDLGSSHKPQLVALLEFEEDFQLAVVPCRLEGNASLYKVIARKQTVPGRSYWGG